MHVRATRAYTVQDNYANTYRVVPTTVLYVYVCLVNREKVGIGETRVVPAAFFVRARPRLQSQSVETSAKDAAARGRTNERIRKVGDTIELRSLYTNGEALLSGAFFSNPRLVIPAEK